MKKMKYICMFLGMMSLINNSLQADDDIDATLQNIGSEQMVDETLSKGYPFRISGRGDWIGQSKIDKKGFKHQHVNFSIVNVQGQSVLFHNATCNEGLALSGGYTYIHFKWDENCFFRENNANLVNVSLSLYSQRLCDWLWQAMFTVNWQPKYKDFSNYSTYDMVFWGRYTFQDDLHFHIGFLTQNGMKIDHIYPIIGFDYTINDRWKINGVFPMNLSIVYTVDHAWSVALAGRIFDVRYRLGKCEKLKKALFQYHNYGAELAVNYDRNHFYFNLHAGVTLGGQFKISNQNNKRKKHFDMESAGYAGGEVAIKF